MSSFTLEDINALKAYVPGEQPKDKSYIKLNTNENPYYTSAYAVAGIVGDTLLNLKRYSDPESTALTQEIASYYGVNSGQVLVTNGSDEALAFIFYAYCRKGVCFPDVTYGFYDVIANLFGCPTQKIPLDSQFRLLVSDYKAKGKTVVIANPNAQTGIDAGLKGIEEIILANSDNIVVVDQAYADFGNTDVIPLVNKYKNLVVVNTFSKSRSLAGARVGYIIADNELIDDLKKIKNSFHPYNVNSISSILAARAMADKDYFRTCVDKIKNTRAYLTEKLQELDFDVLPSSANFVLARSNITGGRELYLALKKCGILVRHFDDARIAEYVRITIGTDSETELLLEAIKEILNDEKSRN